MRYSNIWNSANRDYKHQVIDMTPSLRKTAVVGILALASMVLFMVLVFEDVRAFQDADWHQLPLALVARYAVAMGLAGALVGYSLYGMFGKSGLKGWALALVGGFLVATIAGIVGSAVGLVPDLIADGPRTGAIIAIFAGALVLPLALIGWPLLLLIWIVLVSLAHIIARSGK